jgi:mRNA interferase RelE/StbE
MPKYNITIKSSALKYIEKQGVPTIKRIMAAIDTLENNPYAGKLLKNHDAQYRLRVGNYRILYDVYDTELIVDVVKVGPRGYVYN